MTTTDAGLAARDAAGATRGLAVAFLGIDRIGKRDLVAAVAARCDAEGLPVRRVSWQRHLGEHPSPAGPGVELERMWLDLYRLFFAGAAVDGRPVDVPETLGELAGHDLLGRLPELPITGVRPEAPVSTAWVEVAGHTLLQQAVVRPLVAAGTVVLQESLGVKNVVKSLLMAEAADPEAAAALALTRTAALDYFGRGLAPDLGFLLTGNPDRVPASGAARIGAFDSLRMFGRDPVESFVDLQRRCAVEYAEFAARFGWRRIDLGDPGVPAGRDAALEEVMAGLRGALGR